MTTSICVPSHTVAVCIEELNRQAEWSLSRQLYSANLWSYQGVFTYTSAAKKLIYIPACLPSQFVMVLVVKMQGLIQKNERGGG